MIEFDYDALDVGIRERVRAMRQAGFETTDSGDGTKDMECAVSQPMVAALVSSDESLEKAADRLAELFANDPPSWIQASYSPHDGKRVVVVMWPGTAP